MSQIARTAQSLTHQLLPFMRQRMEELGVDASGAYNFYRVRLAADCIFSDHEVRLVEAIAERLPRLDEVHEIGCGWGQLVLLLAWCGYSATGFEIDSQRFRGAEALREALSVIEEDRAVHAKLRNEFFPPLDRPEGRSTLVIATNIVVSDPHIVEEHIVWALRRYRYAIIDVDRFCKLRQSSQRQGLIEMVERVGLRSAGLFCDAGADGQYYLFERTQADNSCNREPVG